MNANFIQQPKIQGQQYQIYLIPAGEGLRMAKTLAQTFLPLWGQFMTSAQEGNLDYSELAISLVGELDTFDVETLVRRLLKECTVDGKEVDFDQYFMGNYGELVEIVAFAIQKNFSSFFAAKGLLGSLLPKGSKESHKAE